MWVLSDTSVTPWSKCLFCGSELTTGDIGGVCTACRNAGYDDMFKKNFEDWSVSRIGWICPRCGASNGPDVHQCMCTPPVVTCNEYQLTIDFNGENNCSTTLGKGSTEPLE